VIIDYFVYIVWSTLGGKSETPAGGGISVYCHLPVGADANGPRSAIRDETGQVVIANE
jgi:hypothetical protein